MATEMLVPVPVNLAFMWLVFNYSGVGRSTLSKLLVECWNRSSVDPYERFHACKNARTKISCMKISFRPRHVHGNWTVHYFMHGIIMRFGAFFSFSCMEISFLCMNHSCHDFSCMNIFVRVTPFDQLVLSLTYCT